MKEKSEQLRLAEAALAYLRERYPACFNPAAPQPLKIGIDHDIAAEAAPEIQLASIKAALGIYVARPEYLKGVVGGRARLDPHGVSAGTVTDAEAAYAARRLELALKPSAPAQAPRAASRPPSPPPPPKPRLGLPKANVRS